MVYMLEPGRRITLPRKHSGYSRRYKAQLTLEHGWPQAAPRVLDLCNLGEADTSPIKEQHISSKGHKDQQMSSHIFLVHSLFGNFKSD